MNKLSRATDSVCYIKNILFIQETSGESLEMFGGISTAIIICIHPLSKMGPEHLQYQVCVSHESFNLSSVD